MTIRKLELPREFLATKERKAMWADAQKTLKTLDKKLNFKEIYAIGSFVSKKKRPCDIDFALVVKGKNNSSWPIDLVLIPDSKPSEYYLNDINKWMKNRYKSSCGIVKLK